MDFNRTRIKISKGLIMKVIVLNNYVDNFSTKKIAINVDVITSFYRHEIVSEEFDIATGEQVKTPCTAVYSSSGNITWFVKEDVETIVNLINS